MYNLAHAKKSEILNYEMNQSEIKMLIHPPLPYWIVLYTTCGRLPPEFRLCSVLLLNKANLCIKELNSELWSPSTMLKFTVFQISQRMTMTCWVHTQRNQRSKRGASLPTSSIHHPAFSTHIPQLPFFPWLHLSFPLHPLCILSSKTSDVFGRHRGVATS